MTQQISTWVTRGTQELQALAPYALAAMSPGGSITAAVSTAIVGGIVSLYRHARVRPARLRDPASPSDRVH